LSVAKSRFLPPRKQEIAQQPSSNTPPITVIVENAQRSEPTEIAVPKPPKKDATPEWALVFVGIVTAAVIGWQSWETRRSADAAGQSARDAKESIILTHRPKVIVRSVVIPWMELLNRRTPLNVLNETELDQGQLGGFFYAVNIGNQRATIRSLDEFMFFGERLPMERPYEVEVGRRELSISLRPGESCKIAFMPKAIKPDELTEMAVYERPFYVMGRIFYVDDLGNSRETAFCRMIDHQRSRVVPVEDPAYEYAE
jgi:hypothetical protein